MCLVPLRLPMDAPPDKQKYITTVQKSVKSTEAQRGIDAAKNKKVAAKEVRIICHVRKYILCGVLIVTHGQRTMISHSTGALPRQCTFSWVWFFPRLHNIVVAAFRFSGSEFSSSFMPMDEEGVLSRIVSLLRSASDELTA